MQYMGGKVRIARHILPIMLKEKKDDQWWVEPFVGGANVIDKVNGKRIGSDINKYLIALLDRASNGYVPPESVSEELYYSIKSNQGDYDPELVGFVGFCCSFGGKWWGGYAQNKRGDNYARAGSRAIARQGAMMKGVEFVSGSYDELQIPDNSIIYCDPPYSNTTKYNNYFDHDLFWEWCRQAASNGNTVFVSEYTAPDDFTCVWEMNHQTNLNKNKTTGRVEKLFRVNHKGTS